MVARSAAAPSICPASSLFGLPFFSASAIAAVIGNSKYNVSRAVRDWLARASCRIGPVHLPSCAPNLCPIERLWRVMKRQVPDNKHHPTFGVICAAFENCFAKIGGWKGKLDTLVTPKFRFAGAPANAIP